MLFNMIKPVLSVIGVSVIVLSIAGCENNSKLRQLPDYELAERYSDCLDNEPSAPGPAQACANMKKECERRKKELGTYICRSR